MDEIITPCVAGTWRIIPVSTWLSPLFFWGCGTPLTKMAFLNINGGY